MRRFVALGVVSWVLVLGACGGAGDGGVPPGGEDASPTPTHEASPTPTHEASPTGTPTGEPAASALVGVWTIDLQDKLRALLAPYGGVPAELSCQGAENLMFGGDGAFLATLAGRCRFDDKSGSVEGEQAGEYEDRGDAFVLRDVMGRLTGEIEGVPVPLATWDTTTGPVPYRVEGDELAITVRMDGGTTVELVYHAA